jgi:hypothetical protein
MWSSASELKKEFAGFGLRISIYTVCKDFLDELVASVRTKYLAFRCPPEHSFPTLNKKIKTCWVPIPKKTGSDWNTAKLLDQDLDITTVDSIIESAW